MSIRRTLVALALLAASFDCRGQEAAAPPWVVQEQWKQDLSWLARRMEEVHPDLFYCLPKARFEKAVAELKAAVPRMNDREIVVGIMRLVARVSEKGRDGHTGVLPRAFKLLPLQLYWFSDGLFVVRAQDSKLIGAQVLKIGETGVEEARRLVDPLVTRDNEQDARSKAAYHLLLTEVLHTLGMSDAPGRAQLTLRRGDKTETLSLEGQSRAAYRGWNTESLVGLPEAEKPMCRSRRQEAFWHSFLVDDTALYVKYNVIARRSASGRTIDDLASTISSAVKEGFSDRVIIDLRYNGGGNNTTYGPLLRALRDDPAINKRGRLYAIVGRHTFSAASNFVTELERDTEVILAGEATGGCPNQFGDTRPLPLPNHPDIVVRVSSRYHQKSAGDDARLTHEPHLAIPLSSRDYFAGRDPVLKVVLRHRTDG